MAEIKTVLSADLVVSRVKAVVFDLYGTLLSIEEPRRPYRQLLDQLREGGRAPRTDDAATIMTVDAGLAGMAAALGGQLSATRLAQLETDLFAELASVRAFDDAVPTLSALRARGLKLALCSNLASPYAVPARLLLPQMDVYGFSFVAEAVKPQAAFYAAVCAELGLPPEDVLMVGDTLAADVEGPLAYGMQACHLVRHGGLSTARYCIRSLKELLHAS